MSERSKPPPNSTPPAGEHPFACARLQSADGLCIRLLANGCIGSIDCNEILINQMLGSPVAGGVHRVYLRIHGRDGIRYVEIVGPAAGGEIATSDDRFEWSGTWEKLGYRCTCWLPPAGGGWFFHVEVENRGSESVRCDAVLVQDVGLGTRGQLRNNEIFNSQYLDHRAVEHPEVGYLLMTRQNLPQPHETHPWLLQGCIPKAAGFTTDGYDFFGVECRGDGAPRALAKALIGTSVRQYEAGYTAIQGNEAKLGARKSSAWTFFAHYEADHPQPSSDADAGRLRAVQAARKELLAALRSHGQVTSRRPDRSIFQTSELLESEDFSEAEVRRRFPGERRHEELQGEKLFSFFQGDDARHIVLKAKELFVARPHGHILRAGRGFMPDAELMSCACYAAGGFASQLALGNTSLAKLTSEVRDTLNLVRSSGMRMFVREEAGGAWKLLAVPSAFEMGLDLCRWYYKFGDRLLIVSCQASGDDPAISFGVGVEGRAVELLVSMEIVAGAAEYEIPAKIMLDPERGRAVIRPAEESLVGKKLPGIAFQIGTANGGAVASVGGDELLFADGQSRGYPYLAIKTRPTNSFSFNFVGALKDEGQAEQLCTKYQSPPATSAGPDAGSEFWSRLKARVRLTLPSSESAAQIQDALAWCSRDAYVHLATPRGLEQRNGSAWGVRDVCQGPIEFLLSYGHCEVAAQIIRRVFAQQYERRGDWPQWFMFPPFEEIQSNHSHGDIVIWPLKALCDYLEDANDGAILHQQLPYVDDETFQPTAQSETILQHVDRLLVRMQKEFLPGVALPRYGDGDWDDSLQPADPALRARMVSSWTAELMYQTLVRYSIALGHFGESKRAAVANEMAERCKADFHRWMMPDGVVAGFAVFDSESARAVEYLLHPRDTRTGLRYRLIPSTRGILSGLFSKEEARRHLDLIREHLLFPDGARLMDRPTTYHGGAEQTFRRSESAAFFGREIGLMYTHGQLRYAEALSVMGCADDLWRALRVVNPIAVTHVVTNAVARQRNCYFSSSDAAYPDRYEASQRFEKLRRGEVPVEGGWRIYSSGPGIFTSLVIRNLLGLRRYFDWIEFDPVLPRELDAATCEIDQFGHRICYRFSVAPEKGARKRMTVNGMLVSTLEHVSNAYRSGAVRVRRDDFLCLLNRGQNMVHFENC